MIFQDGHHRTVTGLVAFGNSCISLAQCSSIYHFKVNYPLIVFPFIPEYLININTMISQDGWREKNDNVSNTVEFLHEEKIYFHERCIHNVHPYIILQ